LSKFLHSSETNNSDIPELVTRESIDLRKWRMLSTADGCGSELNAMRKICGELSDLIDEDENDNENFDEDEIVSNEVNSVIHSINENIISSLPEQCDHFKHTSTGTNLFQSQDTADLHLEMKAQDQSDKFSLIEG